MGDTTQGRLLYVIGPSGAGKDSILAGARARLERAECFERSVPDAVVIDNDGPLTEAVDEFCRLITNELATSA